MKISNILLLVFLVISLAGCVHGPSFDPRAPANLSNDPTKIADDALFTPIAITNQIDKAWLKPPQDLYRLGPGDVVEIEVLGETESQATAIVGPDGKIYYGMLPGTFVWGLTLTESKVAMELGLKKFVKTPQEISITLKQVGSKRVWILGNVQSPGVHPLSTPTTLLEGISAAGGVLNVSGAPDGVCDLQRSFVMRDGKLIPVDFVRLLREGDLSQNIYLQPNDFVYLRSGLTRNVYVLGAVAAPRVVPYADQMTVLTAIMSCGGPVPYARMEEVAIVRGSLANPNIGAVDVRMILRGQAPDVKLQPGDIVCVSFVPWRKAAIFGETILGQFVRTIAVNEGYRAVIPNAQALTPTLPIGR